MSTLPVVLMYHSIAEAKAGADPFDLHVSPQHFRSQIEALAGAKRIVSLAELAAQLQLGRREPDTVALTFDDGYQNNLTVAAPILRKVGAPATLFVAPRLLGRKHFWWDKLIGMLATATRIPATLSDLAVASDRIDEFLASLRQSGSQSARMNVALQLWSELRRLDLDSIDAAIVALMERFAPWPASESLRPMQKSEIRDAAATFEIGAHTMSHPQMTQIDAVRLTREIVGSKLACEDLSGRPVAGFAYPFGDVNSTVAEAVSRHFAFACTTREAALERSTRPALIPRIHVRNWSGAKLLERIQQVSRVSRMPRALQLANLAVTLGRQVAFSWRRQR